MPIKPSARPEPYAALVSRSLQVYWQVLPRVLPLALLVALIVFIPRLIGLPTGQDLFFAPVRSNSVALLFVAMYFSGLWFMAAILWAINCIERHRHSNFIVDLEMAGKRIFFVFGAAILLFIIGSLTGVAAYILNLLFLGLKLYAYNKYVTGFSFFLVLLTQVGLSIFISTLFYFYFPLIVIENDGILLALKQSAHLVWDHVWRTLQLQLTPWLAYFIALMLIKNIFQLNTHIYITPSNPAVNICQSLAHIIVLALFIPWVGSMMLVQLRDLEMRTAKTTKTTKTAKTEKAARKRK